MRKRPSIRFVNGLVAAIVLCFFAVHGILGVTAAFGNTPSPFAVLVWVGVALVGVHVVLSIFTSIQQLNDRDHPPSARKKRHLALKWATGILLLAVAAAHVVCVRVAGGNAMLAQATGVAVIAILMVVLAIHACVGAKSLLTDLGAGKRHLTALRVAICAACALLGGAVVVAFVL